MSTSITPAQVLELESRLSRSSFAPGELIGRSGDAADRIFFIVSGEVSVSAELVTGKQKRLSTLSAGMTFGELAMVNRSPRSADVRADTKTECYALAVTEFDRLGEKHPEIKLTLLENLLRTLSRTAARLTGEVLALSR